MLLNRRVMRTEGSFTR